MIMLSSLLTCVTLLAAGVMPQDCTRRTQWGGDACTLHGTLEVTSTPARLLLTQQKCNLFYHKGDFKKQPAVKLPDASTGETYTVVMVDPDAPNHPEGKYYLHWIVANVPGSDLREGNLKNATVITAYHGPSPPEGTGTHRYMMLVYRQTTRLTGPVSDSQRRLFDLAAWTLKSKLCGPVSGRQFRTNYSGKEKDST